MKKIELIVPVYNEEESIFKFYEEVNSKLIPYCPEDIKINIVFINDGSKDTTLKKLKELHSLSENVSIINLSRNFGKENALFAGLDQSEADAVVPIDVDLQDPIELILLMIDKWKEGAKVVLAKRSDRETDTYFKRKTAEMFYKFHNVISEIKIPENVGDYRLIDKIVVDEIKKLNESNLFMKGLFSWVGYYDETTMIEYKRAERKEGKTKFNAWKLWNLAVEGITSFSTLPLRIWCYIGFFMASVSFLFGFKIIIDKLIFGNDIAGYPSLFVAITFIGGIQLIGLGVMGEYIGRIYNEVKNRPKYIIREKIEPQKTTKE
jgi:glycosyltransferase involved in cell wall biosynthesis